MIRINQLNFHYQKKKPLFQNLDLEIPPGKIYGLLGRNGAGKTTLLRLLGGLLFPKGGSITVNGQTPQRRNPELLSDIFFMPEEIFVPNLPIHRFLKNYAPFYPSFDRSRFDEFLGTFGLSHEDNIKNLSYGQKKKVMLGFGIASGASLLILDEPTNGLDIPSKARFRQIMAESISDDRTVIVSTHQVRDVSNLIEQVLILEEGEMLFNESIATISTHLTFRIRHQAPPPEEALYAERIPGGYMAVEPVAAGEYSDTEVDLEVLFNALISDNGTISELFNTPVQ